MKYKIQIKSFEEVESTDEKYQIISDTGNKTDGGKAYGYVPYKTTRIVEKEVLAMELDELDIKKVVNALINQ